MLREQALFAPRMSPNIPDKLNLKRTLLISLGFLSVLIALSYYNFMVPLLLYDMIPEDFKFFFIGQNILVGGIMTIDNILAVALQPYFAALSDRTESKFGRRMPFIIVGVLSCAFFFAVAPWIRLLVGFIIVLFFFNIFMSFYRSTTLALMADYTPDKVRPTASGIQQLIANTGASVAFLLPGLIGFLAPNLDITTRRSVGFPVISVGMLVCLVILYFTIKETPTGDGFIKISKRPIALDPVSFELKGSQEGEDAGEDKSMWATFHSLFRPERRATLFFLFTIFSWWTAFGAIEAFFSSFAVNYLGLTDGEAGILVLIYPVSMTLSAVFVGMFGQRIGRKKSLFVGTYGLIILIGLNIAVAIPTKNIAMIGVLLALIGVFWMMIIVNTFPVVWAYAPEGEIGAFTGIYYTFNQGAAIASPILMGLVFDFLGGGMGNDKFLFLYPFMLGCVLVALLFLFLVRGEEKDLSEEEIEELRSQFEEID